MKWKKSLSLMLALALLIACLPPLTASAEETAGSVTAKVSLNWYGEGSDTAPHGKVQIGDRAATNESDTAYFEAGTEVTITAYPDDGYRLAYWMIPGGWPGGLQGSTTATVKVSRGTDQGYTAVFVSTARAASAEMEDIDLGYASEGYTAVDGSAAYPDYKIKGSLTVQNTGESILMPYGFTLDEAGSQYFRVGQTYRSAAQPLRPGQRNSWYWIVYPKEGLGVGTYTGTVTFVERCQAGLDTPVSATVTFEVTDDPIITTNVSPSDSGTVEGGGRYKAGDPVTLTATPNEHYRFVKWSNGATENPYTFTAAEAQTISAVFEKYEFRVNAGWYVNSTGRVCHGKVRINDRPAAESDSAYFEKGTEVTVTAIPDEGYRLSYWSGPGGFFTGNPGSASVTFNVTADTSYSACFISTDGTAAAEMEDIDIGTYSEGYQVKQGTEVVVKGDVVLRNTGSCELMPAGFIFDEEGAQYFRAARTYSGSSLRPINGGAAMADKFIVFPKDGLPAGTYRGTIIFQEQCQPALETPVSAVVTFTVTPKFVITAEVSPESAGSVTGLGEFASGETVTLTAEAGDNYAFSHWVRADGSESTENPYSFAAEKSECVKAVFERTSYKVTVAADPEEGGSVGTTAFEGLSADLPRGTPVTVTAEAKPGYRFRKWTDNGRQVGTEASITVEAVVDHELVAHFEKLEQGEVPAGVSLTYSSVEQTAYADTGVYTVVSGGSGTKAGSYTAVLSLNDGAVWSDLTTGDKSVDWEIVPAPVTVTVRAEDRAYQAGNTEVTLAAVAVHGAFGGDDVTVDLSAAKGVMADDAAGLDKDVTVTGVKLGGADAANYSLTAQPDGVKADIAKLTFLPEEAAGSAKYGNSGTVELSAMLAPGASFGTPNVDDGAELFDDIPTIGGTAMHYALANDPANAGRTAAVTVPVSGGANYEDYAVTVAITVLSKTAQADLRFPQEAITVVLGGPDFSLAVSGAAEGSAVTYESSDVNVVTVDEAGTAHIVGAGTATVTASAAETAEYASAAITCTVTVKLPFELTAAVIDGAMLVAAAYDAGGRFVGVRAETLDLTVGVNSFTFSGLGEGASYRVFLTDADARPLADLWTGE